MDKTHDKWNIAIGIASSLGASDAAIQKWRQRGGIPASWAMRIVFNSDGKITLDDFKKPA